MRTKDAIKARLDEVTDDLWLYRHTHHPIPQTVPDDIRQEAERQAVRIRTARSSTYLRDLLEPDGWQIHEVMGEVMALRWVNGMSLSDPAILDT